MGSLWWPFQLKWLVDPAFTTFIITQIDNFFLGGTLASTLICFIKKCKLFRGRSFLTNPLIHINNYLEPNTVK